MRNCIVYTLPYLMKHCPEFMKNEFPVLIETSYYDATSYAGNYMGRSRMQHKCKFSGDFTTSKIFFGILTACWSIDFVVDLWKCAITGKLFAHSVVQWVIKHLTKFFKRQIRVCIQHLKPANSNNTHRLMPTLWLKITKHYKTEI